MLNRVTRRDHFWHELEDMVAANEHLTAAAVTAKLMGVGQCYDDEITDRRWMFDPHGRLVRSTWHGDLSPGDETWTPGLHELAAWTT